jgi:hypothetical protein
MGYSASSSPAVPQAPTLEDRIMKKWCFLIVLLFNPICGFGDTLSLEKTTLQQESVGQICRNPEYAPKVREYAFAMLGELIKSDGEYFVAADELLKLLEQDPDFFFKEMKLHPDSFQTWLWEVQASSFRAPYVYTDIIQMEYRRKSIIQMLKHLAISDPEKELLKEKILKHLESFQASEVDK